MRRAAAAAVVGAVVAALGGQAAPADTILVNGHVVTVDARFTVAQAVAVAAGKFTAVGTD